jgi:hypothetical protein
MKFTPLLDRGGRALAFKMDFATSMGTATAISEALSKGRRSVLEQLNPL